MADVGVCEPPLDSIGLQGKKIHRNNWGLLKASGFRRGAEMSGGGWGGAQIQANPVEVLAVLDSPEIRARQNG